MIRRFEIILEDNDLTDWGNFLSDDIKYALLQDGIPVIVVTEVKDN